MAVPLVVGVRSSSFWQFGAALIACSMSLFVWIDSTALFHSSSPWSRLSSASCTAALALLRVVRVDGLELVLGDLQAVPQRRKASAHPVYDLGAAPCR